MIPTTCTRYGVFMALHRLQVLAPGRRCVGKDRHGRKRYVEFSPEYCSQQYARNQAMIDAGIPVPLSWEHRSDAKPGVASRDDIKSKKARFGIPGYVERYELDDRNQVWAAVEIPDDGDAKQAKTLRFCSPEIDVFTDGNGRDWGEVFTHIALTPRPVQHEQPPIAQLSLTQTGPLRLSVDPYEGTDMADETDDKPKDTKPEKKDSSSTGGDTMSKALDMLAKKGIVLPDDTTPENVWERIIIALTAIEGAEEPLAEPMDDATEPIPNASSDPISMSHNATHPALAKQLAKAEQLERSQTTGRINRLVATGRITPVIGRKLAGELTKIRLSFGDDGDINPTSVHTKIEAYEALPKNTAWKAKATKGVQLSHTATVEPPEEELSDAEFQKQWNSTTRRA